MNSLSTKYAREQWEKEFNDHYIQPVLGKLDLRLHNAVDLIASDDKQGNHVLHDINGETPQSNFEHFQCLITTCSNHHKHGNFEHVYARIMS